MEMSQESSANRYQLPQNSVHIESGSPPEEILASVTGGFGLWQISVVSLSLVAHFISELELLAMKLSLPSDLNFTCADGNGSRCVTANGSVCTDFVFFKGSHYVKTFTEELKLICELGHYPKWIKGCYLFGLAVGFFLAGALVNRFGQKLMAMIFISLSCFTGILVISMKSVWTLFMYVVTHATFSVILIVVPLLAVCDSVGNKWRTFALGLTYMPRSLCTIVLPCYYRLFANSSAAIAVISLLPLVLLIPLQYFHDSPNYVCLVAEFEKSEKALCEIAKCSRTPIPETTRLRPIHTVLSSNIPKRTTFLKIFEHPKMKESFMALFTLWFFVGYTNSLLAYYAYPDVTHLTIFGCCGLVGNVTSLTLCHRFPQRVVLGVFELLKCLSIAGLFACALYFDNFTSTPFVVLRYASGFFYVASVTVLIVISPRMFPTELRAFCVGLCGCIYHFGYFLANILRHFSKAATYVTEFFLVVSPIFEIVACLWLWDVHNRELPDFLTDCIRFRKYYKPTRYIMIYDLEQHDETEIQVRRFSQLERQ